MTDTHTMLWQKTRLFNFNSQAKTVNEGGTITWEIGRDLTKENWFIFIFKD